MLSLVTGLLLFPLLEFLGAPVALPTDVLKAGAFFDLERLREQSEGDLLKQMA